MKITAGKLWGLRRLADQRGIFTMTAVDQRPPIKTLVAERRGLAEAPYDDVASVKRLLVEELADHSSAMLLDPHYAYPAAIDAVRPAQGLLLTLEDSIFEDLADGRKSSAIDHWSVQQIKRAGGDAVKVLAWYRPDAAPEVLDHQQEFVAAIGEECRNHDIPFVFELLVYAFPTESGHTTGYVEQAAKRTEHVLESVETFSAPRFGVDLFKLESPVPAGKVPSSGEVDSDDTMQAFRHLDRAASRPWVMLSAGATQDAFARILDYAFEAGASGFLAGRAIWWDAFQSFPDWDVFRSELRTGGVPYMQRISRLAQQKALPWHRHRAYQPDGPELDGAGPGFRLSYSPVEDRR